MIFTGDQVIACWHMWHNGCYCRKLTWQVQIQDEAVCASLCVNATGKGMNPSILSPAMGK